MCLLIRTIRVKIAFNFVFLLTASKGGQVVSSRKSFKGCKGARGQRGGGGNRVRGGMAGTCFLQESPCGPNWHPVLPKVPVPVSATFVPTHQ